ncbi:hypothetical protein QQZ08_009160 [Neonectria magnoliae]|uniref:Major facilitator superfamily (MFS) profile domain-containing protein n=1 Tax=Neonectria magnoliae TaxID=2732573 RepID=A0ABR1HQ26_9HYPO
MASNEARKVQEVIHVETASSFGKFIFSKEVAKRGAAIQEEWRNLSISKAARRYWKSVMFSSVALWSAMSSHAQATGAFSAGFLMDQFGRTYAGSGLSTLTIAGAAVQFVAKDRGVLLVGKMINSFGVRAAMAVGVIYASEMAPVKL